MPLVENGTRVLSGSQMDSYATGEITLAKAVPPCLCGLWKQGRASGADLLWRVKQNMRLVSGKRLPDGSHVIWIYPSEGDWRFLITITSGGKSKPPWTS